MPPGLRKRRVWHEKGPAATKGRAACRNLLFISDLWQRLSARCQPWLPIALESPIQYTQGMKTITIAALQTQCVAVVEEVATTGEPVTILHHGYPVAQLVPSGLPSGPFPQETLHGTVHIHGDIEAPVLPPDAWEAEGPPQP